MATSCTNPVLCAATHAGNSRRQQHMRPLPCLQLYALVCSSDALLVAVRQPSAVPRVSRRHMSWGGISAALALAREVSILCSSLNAIWRRGRCPALHARRSKIRLAMTISAHLPTLASTAVRQRILSYSTIVLLSSRSLEQMLVCMCSLFAVCCLLCAVMVHEV